jgi:DNA repair ATPase RecN
MSEMNTKYMRDASYLLPPPGGEVVRQLLDDYATLLASHNELWNFYNQLESAMYEFEREARTERMKRVAAERFTARYKEISASAVEQNNALREAVKWERECEWLNDRITERYAGVPEIASEEEEISVSYLEARAEVDRLLGGE